MVMLLFQPHNRTSVPMQHRPTPTLCSRSITPQAPLPTPPMHAAPTASGLKSMPPSTAPALPMAAEIPAHVARALVGKTCRECESGYTGHNEWRRVLSGSRVVEKQGHWDRKQSYRSCDDKGCCVGPKVHKQEGEGVHEDVGTAICLQLQRGKS